MSAAVENETRIAYITLKSLCVIFNPSVSVIVLSHKIIAIIDCTTSRKATTVTVTGEKVFSHSFGFEKKTCNERNHSR